MRWRWWPVGPVSVLVIAAVQANCSGGTGSALQSCPPATEVIPNGTCTSGRSCTSAAALPDCPGSTGSLTCNCTAAGWSCFDPSAHTCNATCAEETVVPGGACTFAFAICAPSANVTCPAGDLDTAADAEADAAPASPTCTCDGTQWTCPMGCTAKAPDPSDDASALDDASDPDASNPDASDPDAASPSDASPSDASPSDASDASSG